MDVRLPGATLLLGDCLDRMAEMPDGSIDAVIGDPPYGITPHAWDTPVDWPRWWAEVKRIGSPRCSIVLFAVQPFATDLIVSNRRWFKYDLVWPKTIATGFLSANRRPLRAHELVLVFGRRPTFNRIDLPRETFNRRPGEVIDRPRAHGGVYGEVKGPRPAYRYGDTECPKSVLRFRSRANHGARSRPGHHPTPKPVDMLEWLVRTYSREGGTVLDPFMGSGPVGEACARAGRRFVGIERDAGFFRVAADRLTPAGVA